MLTSPLLVNIVDHDCDSEINNSEIIQAYIVSVLHN